MPLEQWYQRCYKFNTQGAGVLYITIKCCINAFSSCTLDCVYDSVDDVCFPWALGFLSELSKPLLVLWHVVLYVYVVCIHVNILTARRALQTLRCVMLPLQFNQIVYGY
jgi:hypothetical protein